MTQTTDVETGRLISLAIKACHTAAASTQSGFVSDHCDNAAQQLRSALRQVVEDDADGN